MAQILVPVSDQATGSWTTTPLWSKVDDDSTVNPSGDGTIITSDAVGNNATTTNADLQLAAGADPNVSTGHVLRAIWDHDTSGRSLDATADLYQGDPASGGTLIASMTEAGMDGSGFVTSTYTLSAGEADSITDYSDLYIRLSGFGSGGGPGRSMTVDLVELEVPEGSTDRQGQISFTELETPDAPRAGQVSHAEFEAPSPDRQGQVSFAELEAPNAVEQPFLDSFDRADSDDLGEDWLELTGDIDIVSNTARTDTATLTRSAAAAQHDQGSTDMYAEATVLVDAIATAGVLARNTADSQDGYFAELDFGNNELKLIRVESGNNTELATKPYTLTLSQTYKVRLEVLGSDLEMFVDDISELTHTDSSPLSSGQHGGIRGFLTDTGFVQWDDFETGALSTDRQGQISHAELETPDGPRQGQVSHAELETPDAAREGQISFAELEAPEAPRQGQVSFAELETGDAPRQGQISFAELETGDAPRQGQISFAELETEDAPRQGQISFAEMETDDPPVRGQVSYAALEAPDAPTTDRRGQVSFAELETEDAARSGQVSFAELETEDAPRTGQVSFAELETEDAPRAGQVSWAELETEDAPRKAQLSFAELETEDAARTGQISFAALEAPNAPRSGQVSFAEFETGDAPITDRSGQVSYATLETPDAPTTDRKTQVSFAELETADAPRSGQISFAELETDDAPRSGQISHAEMEVADAPRRAEVSHAALETEEAPRAAQLSFAELETDEAPRSGQVSFAEIETPDAARSGQVSFAELETTDAPRSGQVSYAALETPNAPGESQVELSWAEFEAPDYIFGYYKRNADGTPKEPDTISRRERLRLLRKDRKRNKTEPSRWGKTPK